MREYSYTTVAGDSFSKICEKRYNDKKAFRALEAYNKYTPDQTLLTGVKLKLPESLIYQGYDAKTNTYPMITVFVILPEVADHVAGPTSVKIGDKAEYKIDKYKSTATADDKPNSQWKIDVFFKDGKKKETIEPEKAKPGYITSTPDKISVDKVPGTWANGSYQVFSFVKKPDPAVSVKTTVEMKNVVLARSKQRPGFHSRVKKDFSAIADDMLFNDYTQKQYAGINTFTYLDSLPIRPSLIPFAPPMRGMCYYTDAELFTEMEAMCVGYFTNSPLSDVVKRMVDRFRIKSRPTAHNTWDDRFEDPVLTSAALAHQSMKDFVKKAKDLTVAAINAASLDILSVVPFEVSPQPVFHTTSDIRNGLTIAINDTWAHDIDLIDFHLLDAKRFHGKIRIIVYDHFGLDEPDLDANLFKPYGAVDGFRAWFILQHLRAYVPFWTVFQTEEEFEGSLP